jgi:hypothetical protein
MAKATVANAASAAIKVGLVMIFILLLFPEPGGLGRDKAGTSAVGLAVLDPALS